MKFTDLGKKGVLLLLCAAMAAPTLSMTSCENKNEPVKTKPTNVYRSETLLTSTYSYDDNNPEGRREFYNLIGSGDAVIVSGWEYDENWNSKQVYISIDTKTGEQTEFSLPEQDTEGDYHRGQTYFAPDGTLWYTEEAWIYDEETGMFYNDLQLYHANLDGSVIASADAYELFGMAKGENQYLYFNSMTPVGDSMYLAYEGGGYEGGGFAQVSGDLTQIRKIQLDNVSYIDRILPKDSGLYVAYTDSTEWKQHLVFYDTETQQLGDPMIVSGTVQNNIYNAVPSDTYDFVYSNQIAFYGYDLKTDTTTELLNWINSDIDASSVSASYIAPDGTIYAMMHDYEDNTETTSVYRMTRVPDEEVKEKYILTLGTLYLDYDVRKAVIAFNRQSEDYRIVIRDYSDYNSEENEWTGAVQQFNNDILTGDIPDIMQLSSDMPVQNYAAKGLFADLYPYIDAEGGYERSDFMENILDAFAVGGKLCEMPTAFYVETLIGKSSLVGDNDGWNIEEMRRAAEALGLEKDPFNGEVTRDTFLQAICTMTRDQFINKDTGECSFDSEEFISILEFCAGLPEKTVWDDVNWEETPDDFWETRDLAYRNDTALLASLWLSNYRSFWQAQEGQFGERISIVGYPTETRNSSAVYPAGEYAISSKTACGEGAWAFISGLLQKQESQTGENSYQFSILKSVNKKMEEYALSYYDKWWSENDYGPIVYGVDDVVEEPVVEDVPVNDEEAEPTAEGGDIVISEPAYPVPGYGNDDDWYGDGEKHWAYYIGENRIDIGMMTQEAVDHVNTFLASLNQVYRVDEKMMSIIKEEASAYFAGQKSAGEVAKLIQSRVGIYVSENR